jgi:isocitrate dehydrogenase
MTKTSRITIARGDGIGPEIMDAVLKILKASEAPLEYDEIEVGEKVYLSGVSSGIPDSAWATLRRNKVFLKAPITTPQGGGYKSLNVTMRKSLGLYANVRPTVSYHPFVPTLHQKMDLVIVRENEEDLYAGIEHRQTDEVVQCLKLISRPGSEKIIRYAFEYARLNGRKKVSCFSKDNIMKMTDGMFHKIFDEVGKEYPEIEKDHWIIDIGAARVAKTPEIFDVIVTSNLYGDILSDIAAEVSGSVGIAGSANIGDHGAMFEAIHGSAPLIAGKGVANPSGLLLGAVQMLVHLGEAESATKIQNAWLRTIEDGVHTFDIFKEGLSTKRVSTSEFADAVIERLGQAPKQLKAVDFTKSAVKRVEVVLKTRAPSKKEWIGVDLFLDTKQDRDGNALAKRVLSALESLPIALDLISNRGAKVWPNGMPETFCTDHWRCRIFGEEKGALTPHGTKAPAKTASPFPVALSQVLSAMEKAGIEVIKTENLYTFDGEKGYSLDQG